jgi:hypothetical protein
MIEKYKSISNSLKINIIVWIIACPFLSYYLDATAFVGCCVGIAGAHLYLLHNMDKALNSINFR